MEFAGDRVVARWSASDINLLEERRPGTKIDAARSSDGHGSLSPHRPA
jgi:hypothetical protein